MEPFPGDILLGAYLVLSLVVLIVGILVLRYRRGIGPGLLIASGSLGMISSSLWVSIHSDLLDMTEIIPLIIMSLSLLVLIASIFLWRARS